MVSEPLERLLGWAVFLVWVVTILACLLAPFLRWRQAGWEARQQLKWLALVATMSALLAVAGFLLTLTDVAPVLGGLLAVVALTGLGVGIPLGPGDLVSLLVAQHLTKHRLRGGPRGWAARTNGSWRTAGHAEWPFAMRAGRSSPR